MPVIILGPTESGRINGSVRARLILKCRNTRAFRSVLRDTMLGAYKDKDFSGIGFYADFNGEIL